MQLFPVRVAIYMRRECNAASFPENVFVAGSIGELFSLPVFSLKRGISADLPIRVGADPYPPDSRR